MRSWHSMAVVLATAVPADPAPRLKDVKPILYYPTAVGEQWELGFDDADGSTKPPFVVASAAEKGGLTTVVVDTVGDCGDRSPGFTVQASAKGVCVVATAAEGPLGDPRWLLKLPARAGDRWEVPVTGRDGKPAVMVRTIGGEEEVTTPAGRFKAIRVDVEYPAGTAWNTEWWAPNRGPVREVTHGNAYTLVLKAVTPSK
jgi:hypothetical protein